MRALLALPLLLAFAQPALVQPAAAQPARAETLLRLSENARVVVRPDELAASLRAEADAPTAAEAQAKVNAAVAKALDLARAVPGVVVSTSGYWVSQLNQSGRTWRASAGIALHSGDGEKLLALIGTLQAQGLATQSLGWRLAPETARRAQSEATRAALGTLRARAEEAAGILGLRFVSFREVRLDGTRPMPAPMPRMAMAAGPAPAPPPSAAAEDVPVEANVEADAVLVPATP